MATASPLTRLLSRLFARGRLTADPPGQTAGRLLGPASVQRTQLGLRSVAPNTGIITLRNGESRVVLSVSGVPVHHQSPDAARAFLTRWANALNTLPADAVWLMRSRPGGLGPAIAERTERSTALATTTPGTGLARLVAAQLKHLVALDGAGATRRNRGYVVLRGTAADVLDKAKAAQGLLRRAGLTATLLRDEALGRAIAESWRPGTELEKWIYKVDFPGVHERPLGLMYERGKPARLSETVTTPS